LGVKASGAVLASWISLSAAVPDAFAARKGEPGSPTASVGTLFRGDQDGPTLEVGLRSGFVWFYGKIAGDSAPEFDLNNIFSGSIPIQVEAGVRFGPHLFLGASFQYGFVRLKHDCSGNVSCSQNEIDLGAQAHWHFRPQGTVDPWVGVGVGYEFLSTRSDQTFSSFPPVSYTLKWRGLQLVNVQVGVELPLTDGINAAPFVQLALGQYAAEFAESGNQTGQWKDLRGAFHELFSIGVRLSFNL
jgi:hypothetical protein